jgi:type IV secretion system protein VirB10
MAVLLTRGPDAVLAKGSTIEMITDRPLQFQKSEIDFGSTQSGNFSDGPGPRPSRRDSGWSRWPF